jgi:hypothetical protein
MVGRKRAVAGPKGQPRTSLSNATTPRNSAAGDASGRSPSDLAALAFSQRILSKLYSAYVEAADPTERIAKLKRILIRAGVPRRWLMDEAKKGHFRCARERRPSISKELQQLGQGLGSMPVAQIAMELARSLDQVRCEPEEAGHHARLCQGYSVSDLRQRFGLSDSGIRAWVRRGLLGHQVGGGHGGARFAEADVIRFIRKHPEQYDLARVNREWFKTMIFGRTAESGEKT